WRKVAMRWRLAQLVAEQREQHRVLPLPVPVVRAPLDSLADEARPLRVRDCALVERVDLQLDPVEPELDEHVALEHARRLITGPAAAEARVDRKAPDLGDAVPLAHESEADCACALAVDLDHESPVGIRLPIRPLDLRDHLLALLDGPPEERPRVLAAHQLEEEVRIVGPRTPNCDAR